MSEDVTLEQPRLENEPRNEFEDENKEKLKEF